MSALYQTVIDQATSKPRVLLHVLIPGQPYTWQRVGFGHRGAYDPNYENKRIFLGELQACVPRLKPDLYSRLAVVLDVHVGEIRGRDAWNHDVDNFAKFYLDAMSPPKRKKGKQPIDISKCFAVWGNDRQVDKLVVDVHRSSLNPHIEILVFEIAQRIEGR